MYDRDSGLQLSSVAGMVFPYEDGRLPVRMTLLGKDYPFFTADTLVFAMLDNHQIPLGDLGLNPRFALTEVGQLSDFEFDFTGLPQDGQRHTLVVWQVNGFALPNEDDEGEPVIPFPAAYPVAEVWIREGG